MVEQFSIAGIDVVVTFKDIKNVHLSVNPPSGAVRIAAPTRMNLDTIRVFAISKLAWIKRQQKKFREQEREPPREFIERESHYVWGKRYLLKIEETDFSPHVEFRHHRLALHIRPNTDIAARQALFDAFYRLQIRAKVGSMIAKWEPILKVKANRVLVQRMKTKWGSCATASRNIRLNTDLAKKPLECLEYIVLHEMTHLIEPTHNARFVALMDAYMPNWQFQRGLLNRLPVRQDEWDH
jgi:predicted metal-dependent hydrolase